MDIYTGLRISLYACEIVAAVAGFLNYRKISNSYWKFFPVYLLIIAAVEIITESSFNINADYEFNIGIHDFFAIPLQFFFFSWLFYQNFKNGKFNKWPVAGGILYFVAWITDILFFRGRTLWFLSFSYTVGNIILLIQIILFFIRLVSGDMILRYSSMMMFWVCLGLFLFYLGSFPLYGMYNTLAAKLPALFNNYWKITMVLDCLMYLLFAYAFIWTKPK